MTPIQISVMSLINKPFPSERYLNTHTKLRLCLCSTEDNITKVDFKMYFFNLITTVTQLFEAAGPKLYISPKEAGAGTICYHQENYCLIIIDVFLALHRQRVIALSHSLPFC